MRPFAIHLCGPNRQPLPVSFEQAESQLTSLERCFFEPDGSFVWVGRQPTPWQLDGMIYDAAGRLQCVDLRGGCPYSQWRALLAALAPPDASLELVQLSDGRLQNLQQFEAEIWGVPPAE